MHVSSIHTFQLTHSRVHMERRRGAYSFNQWGFPKAESWIKSIRTLGMIGMAELACYKTRGDCKSFIKTHKDVGEWTQGTERSLSLYDCQFATIIS